MAKAEYIYGWHAISNLLEEFPEQVIQIYLLKGRDDKRAATLLQQAPSLGIQTHVASKEALNKLADTEYHQGVVAQIKPAPIKTENDLWQLLDNCANPLLLVLDQVTDAHNLGACMRSAACLGVDAIVCPKDHSATITAATRKTAAGAVEKLPFIQVGNLARTLKLLKDRGVWVVGTELNAEATALQDAALTGPLALVMGAEDTGIRHLTAQSCDALVYIPMTGALQSLNVSVATGIALYEINRQRTIAATK